MARARSGHKGAYLSISLVLTTYYYGASSMATSDAAAWCVVLARWRMLVLAT